MKVIIFFSDQVFETLNEPENTVDDESEDEDQTKKIFYSAKKKLEQVKLKFCCNNNCALSSKQFFLYVNFRQLFINLSKTFTRNAYL